MMLHLFGLVALFTTTTSAASLNGWVASTPAINTINAKQQHRLTFWLTPIDPAAVFRAADDISNPKSSNYRDYLNDIAITELVRSNGLPHLIHWLDSYYTNTTTQQAYHLELSKHQDYAHVTLPTLEWEKIFAVPLISYHQEELTIHRLATGVQSSAEHVPEILHGHVSAVFGLSDFYPLFANSKKQVPTRLQDGECAGSGFKGKEINPDVLRATYHGDAPPAAGSHRPGYGKHSQAVAAFEQAQFVPSDVSEFQQNYSLTQEKVQVVGPNKGGYYGEASLDTQYIFSTGSGVSTYYIAQNEFNMLEWAWLAMNVTHPPQVLSVSWGGGESNYDLTHQLGANVEFAKMGMQGVTVITASGDAGTGNTGFFGCKKFDPTWPASSPYVTSVGGTSLEQDETGWKDSGGGFSSIFERPNYQDVRVGSYIKTTKLPDAQYFNVSGRGTPDVAALATNYRLLTKGAWGCLSGTSAATPVFSGLISLINDELVAAGKPTVGFINPTLYGAAAESDGLGFDVLEGENTKSPCKAGFIAQKGWDAVTGLGTPLMENLKKILIAA